MLHMIEGSMIEGKMKKHRDHKSGRHTIINTNNING